MSAFCQECSVDLWGEDDGDFADLGDGVAVLCETCGWIKVDNNGKRLERIND